MIGSSRTKMRKTLTLAGLSAGAAALLVAGAVA